MVPRDLRAVLQPYVRPRTAQPNSTDSPHGRLQRASTSASASACACASASGASGEASLFLACPSRTLRHICVDACMRACMRRVFVPVRGGRGWDDGSFFLLLSAFFALCGWGVYLFFVACVRMCMCTIFKYQQWCRARRGARAASPEPAARFQISIFGSQNSKIKKWYLQSGTGPWNG